MTASPTVVALFVFACGEFLLALGSGDRSGSRIAGLLLFVPLIACYLGLSLEPVQRTLRANVSTTSRASLVMALLVVAIAAYCAGAGLSIARRTLPYVPYLFAPLLVLRVAANSSPDARAGPGRQIRQVVAAVLLWLPLGLGWLRLPIVPGFDASHLIAIVAALYLFLIVDPLEGIGYSFALGPRDWAIAMAAVLAFTVIALPIGLGTGFLAWHPRSDADAALALPVRIYLATAIPEEFLFRGISQNLAVRALGFPAGLIGAAVVFGLAHPPDPRYMVLAALAGVAYGWVYQRTGRITASAITHAAVDWIWKLLFRL